VQADCPSAIIWDYLRLLIRSHLGHRSISAARRKTRYRLQPNRSQRALTPPARAHTNYSLPPDRACLAIASTRSIDFDILYSALHQQSSSKTWLARRIGLMI
jgi:hypothetical protein